MSVAQVTIHESQFPEAVQRDLIESLRRRQVNHKFHYDSIKQTNKWLALHQAYSPSRNDQDCTETYDCSFAEAVKTIETTAIQLIGLGCGGGQKDARLLRLLRQAGVDVAYCPSDVSAAMVLVARKAALSVISESECWPLVCDLASVEDLETVFGPQTDANVPRLITFFGMIPNFETELILPRLAGFIRPGDQLLFSANLAPGADYLNGIKRVLPLYDNALTQDWLMTFLLDLGVEMSDGEVRFSIENDPAGSELKRIAAYFHFSRAREIKVESESFHFAPGDSIRLFFSYRHTPAFVKTLLGRHQLQITHQWVTQSGEEGVFLCGKN